MRADYDVKESAGPTFTASEIDPDVATSEPLSVSSVLVVGLDHICEPIAAENPRLLLSVG